MGSWKFHYSPNNGLPAPTQTVYVVPPHHDQMIAQRFPQEIRDRAARELNIGLGAAEILGPARLRNLALGQPELPQLLPTNAQKRDGAGRQLALDAHA